MKAFAAADFKRAVKIDEPLRPVQLALGLGSKRFAKQPALQFSPASFLDVKFFDKRGDEFGLIVFAFEKALSI